MFKFIKGSKYNGAKMSDKLSGLIPGQKALIKNISDSCQGIERRRLMDLGFIPGSVVEVALKSPFNDPTAYLVKDAMIALRDIQADLINIEPA